MRQASMVLVGALLAAPATATAGNPWEDLMGPGKPQIWSDPKSRFHLDLPVGWQALPEEVANAARFGRRHPDYGHSALVTVEVRTIPRKVRLRHFAHRVESEVKKVAPGYRVLTEERIKVGGRDALRRHFLYRDKNNAQLYREVVQIVTLVPERAFVITLEMAYGTRNLFWEDFEKMVKGFKGRAVGEEKLPMPKRRRRIKSGEMINPDAIRY